MVYNATRHAKLPFRNATLQPHLGRIKSQGQGMGSVLLRTGGPGGASSYTDIDDYIATTGINPYTRSKKMNGMGLKSKLADKLSKLTIETREMPSARRKNIKMSM